MRVLVLVVLWHPRDPKRRRGDALVMLDGIPLPVSLLLAGDPTSCWQIYLIANLTLQIVYALGPIYPAP